MIVYKDKTCSVVHIYSYPITDCLIILPIVGVWESTREVGLILIY